MVKKTIENEYDKKLELYKQLENEVVFILRNKLAETNIKINNIEHRIKTKESFINKVNVKDYKLPFKDINDLLGVRVITLFLSDIDKVIAIIKNSFVIVEEDDKINSEYSDFGYLSVHLIAKLKKEFIGPRYDKIKELLFEVQIRTITMHSWANISHYLDYKGDFDIPKELKRDFFALSGLFYVADQHFELFFNQSKKNQELIEKKFQKGINIANQEINLFTLNSYLKTKFPDRKHANLKGLSEVVKELKEFGYQHIKQLEEAFSLGWDAFLEYENDHPPQDNDNNPTRYMDIGVIRVLLEIVDDSFVIYESPEEYNIEKYRRMIKK